MPEIHKTNLEVLFYPLRTTDPRKNEYALECSKLGVAVKGSTPGAALEKFGNALKMVKKEVWEKALF